MTVCIAALCDRGQSVIVVADRMITSGLMIEFEHESPKIEKLCKQCFASTSGDALAHTELFDTVHQEIDELRQPSVEQVAECIKHAYQEVRQRRILERILRPRGISSLQMYYEIIGRLPGPLLEHIEFQISSYDYKIDILLAGRSYHKARIYQITDPGTSSCYDAIHFHAIGSGFNLAVASLIGSGFHCGIKLPEALMLLLDARQAAKNAPGVGDATDLAIITGDFDLMVKRERIAQLFALNESRRRGTNDWQNGVIEFIKQELAEAAALPPTVAQGANHGSNQEEPRAKTSDSGGVPGVSSAD